MLYSDFMDKSKKDPASRAKKAPDDFEADVVDMLSDDESADSLKAPMPLEHDINRCMHDFMRFSRCEKGRHIRGRDKR